MTAATVSCARLRLSCFGMLVAVSHASLCGPGLADAAVPTAWPPSTPILNEIRVDQPGTDVDEFVELLVPAGAEVAGLSVVVIGDGTGLSGCIDDAITIPGGVASPGLPGVSYFLIAQPQLTLGVPDLVVPLEFENSDNLTFLLVEGFTGAAGQDLDLDDDGTLDVTPWSAVLDAVSLVENLDEPPSGTEWWYAPPIGPGDNGDPPFAIHRCPEDGAWRITPNDTAWGWDTPGDENRHCEPPRECAADLNGDGIVDGIDLDILLQSWGAFRESARAVAGRATGEPPAADGVTLGREGATAGEDAGTPAADLNGDGTVDAADLGLLLMAWEDCRGVTKAR